jgi:RNA polymerase sigma factor (TIGR02999 family)
MPPTDRTKPPELSQGNKEALGEAVPLIYAELRRLAGYYLGRERGYHTLQSTALVHEAYLRLVEQREVHWENKQQFVGIAAQLMRRILVDHGRRLQASKRGGDLQKVFIEEATLVSKERGPDVVALDQALTRLAELDPQQARLVELRFFGGLTIEEAAGVLGFSPATAKRNWTVAKAWLGRELRQERDTHA